MISKTHISGQKLRGRQLKQLLTALVNCDAMIVSFLFSRHVIKVQEIGFKAPERLASIGNAITCLDPLLNAVVIKFWGPR